MVTVEQEHFNISRSDPATLIIYNVTEADEAVYSCDVETDKKTWTDVIQVKVGGKSLKKHAGRLTFKLCSCTALQCCIVCIHRGALNDVLGSIQDAEIESEMNVL